MRRLAKIIAAAGVIALGILAPHSAMADTYGDYLVRDGVVVYYAVVPAAQIRLYPKHSPERRMHGGVPNGRDVHHLMVALFDAEILRRIVDANVAASVTEVGLAGRRKPLEPFVVNDAQTYCNYFRMARRTHYRIRIEIQPADSDSPLRLAFGFRPR